jgi:GNAT superfamily N-acetyltransferase
MFSDMGHNDAEILATIGSVTHDYLVQAMPSGGYLAWLAIEDEQVLGGVGLVVNPWPGSPGSALAKRACVLSMYVVPAARRRGIARALMNEVLEYCRAQGFRSVYVHASDAGRPLYESLGFIPTNEMRLDLRHD